MATLRELLTRDKQTILAGLAQGAYYPYYIGDILYWNSFPNTDTIALTNTPEYQEIILGIVPGQRYGCMNNVCTPQVNGAYTESTCAGACKKATSSNSGIIIFAGLAGLGLALLKGRK